MRLLRSLIWTYFWLLIFEGALRKWLFPGIADILLLVRDPVAIIIFIRAFSLGIYPRTIWTHSLMAMATIFAVVGLLQLVGGVPVKLQVVVYGWRTYFVHLPLIFIIPVVFRFEDVVSMLRMTLILSIPMILLVVVQYLTPDFGWINAAAQEGGQLAFVGDKIRPPGTFSFNTGAACFFALATAGAASALLGMQGIRRALAWLGMLSAAAYIPISGGRLNAGSVLIVMLVGVICSGLRMGWGQVRIMLVTSALVLGLTYTPIFQDGVESTRMRLEGAAEFENDAYTYGFISRVFGGFAAPLQVLSGEESIFMGEGLGLGTIGGAKLQTGQGAFLLDEGEWGRILSESGWAWGMLYLIWRVALTVWLLRLSILAFQHGSPLAILLWSANVWTLLQGQWGQPTNQGFAVLLAGLNFAACQVPIREKVELPWAVRERLRNAASVPDARLGLRGRRAG